MTDKIEIGEYGRTNLGKIIKFAWIEYSEGKRDDNKVLLINNDIVSDYFYYFKIGEKIVKHSKNIIDLIETGDYVNGKEVIEVREQNGKIYLMTDYVPQSYIKDEIKSILTKEQYEQNVFKVVE